MKRKFLDFSVIKEEITQNNVLEMAELIAFMELRFQIGYLGSRAQKMYADLYGDIKHKNELGYKRLQNPPHKAKCRYRYAPIHN